MIERAIFDKAQETVLENWRKKQDILKNKAEREPSANGPFLGKIYCGKCGNNLARASRGLGKKAKYSYCCTVLWSAENRGCVAYIPEEMVMEAVSAALKYQISLAKDFQKKYGSSFYKKVEKEAEDRIKQAVDECGRYNEKMEQLYEHYVAGILSKEDYLAFRESYIRDRSQKEKSVERIKTECRHTLESLRTKMEWTTELIRQQEFETVDWEIAKRFIERITVISKKEIKVDFWFQDIFEEHSDEGDQKKNEI